jgi:hypothetical protein
MVEEGVHVAKWNLEGESLQNKKMNPKKETK